MTERITPHTTNSNKGGRLIRVLSSFRQHRRSTRQIANAVILRHTQRILPAFTTRPAQILHGQLPHPPRPGLHRPPPMTNNSDASAMSDSPTEEAAVPTKEDKAATMEEEAVTAPVVEEEEVAPAVEGEATAPASEEEAIPTETEETAENTPSPTDAVEETPSYPEDFVWEPSMESVNQKDGSVLLGYCVPIRIPPQQKEEPKGLDVLMEAFSNLLNCGDSTPVGNMNEENCLQQAPVEQPVESEPTEEEAADEEPSTEDAQNAETVRSSSFDRTASAKKQVNLDVGNNIGDEMSPEEEDNRNECSDANVNPALVEVEARC